MSALIAASGCASAGLVDMPPETLQVDVATRVSFVSDVQDLCSVFGVEATIPGTTLVACTTSSGELVAPNPCDWPSWDGYARLLCHELGHANGWSHQTPVVQIRDIAESLPSSDVAAQRLAAADRDVLVSPHLARLIAATYGVDVEATEARRLAMATDDDAAGARLAFDAAPELRDLADRAAAASGTASSPRVLSVAPAARDQDDDGQADDGLNEGEGEGETFAVVASVEPAVLQLVQAERAAAAQIGSASLGKATSARPPVATARPLLKEAQAGLKAKRRTAANMAFVSAPP